MKRVKVNFCGFWPKFDKNNNFIINVLKKYYEIEIVEKPDYIFCTVFSDEYLNFDCVRIFYTGEMQSPDFNLFDYAIGFDYLDYGKRYYRLPYYMVDQNPVPDHKVSNLELAVRKHLDIKEDYLCNREFCSFVYSNYRADLYRKQLFDKLSEYKMIDSGGRYLNNIGKAVPDKISFERNHKFSIAFENGQFSGYTTEKLIHAFAAKTVPIYWGDPEIGRMFNSKAFINCMEYKNIDEVIEKIIEIDNNNELYVNMLQEPMLINKNDIEKMWQGYEKFLKFIFDQPYEDCFQRNRVFWGERYERYMHRAAILDYFYKKLEGIYVKLREFVYRMMGKLRNKKIHEG